LVSHRCIYMTICEPLGHPNQCRREPPLPKCERRESERVTQSRRRGPHDSPMFGHVVWSGGVAGAHGTRPWPSQAGKPNSDSLIAHQSNLYFAEPPYPADRELYSSNSGIELPTTYDFLPALYSTCRIKALTLWHVICGRQQWRRHGESPVATPGRREVVDGFRAFGSWANSHD
jgi:hypothetical protein